MKTQHSVMQKITWNCVKQSQEKNLKADDSRDLLQRGDAT